MDFSRLYTGPHHQLFRLLELLSSSSSLRCKSFVSGTKYWLRHRSGSRFFPLGLPVDQQCGGHFTQSGKSQRSEHVEQFSAGKLLSTGNRQYRLQFTGQFHSRSSCNIERRYEHQQCHLLREQQRLCQCGCKRGYTWLYLFMVASRKRK